MQIIMFKDCTARVVTYNQPQYDWDVADAGTLHSASVNFYSVMQSDGTVITEMSSWRAITWHLAGILYQICEKQIFLDIYHINFKF